MATLDDVRKIALALPETAEGEGERFGVSVSVKGKQKGFVWAWAERVHPKKAKVINNDVLAIVVRSLVEKEIILGSNSQKYFTEPHYNGFPAVLVRIAEVEPDELEDLLIEAWKCKASPASVKAYESQTPAS